MKNRLAMAASVLIRMGASLAGFILLARGLGPATYGLVATVFAYATLASLLTDFGFASKTLRDISAEPERGGSILNACLNLKIILTLFAMTLGLIVLWIIPKPLGTGLPVAMFGAAVLIGAIGDLALTAYRAKGKYVSETVLTAWTSLVHVLGVGWVALAHGHLLGLAVCFLLSRTLYALAAVAGAERLFVGLQLKPEPMASLLANLREAWTWALDSGLNYLSAQVDSLVVMSIFGPQGAGIYQAGARFVQASLSMSAILANIHLPRLSRRNAEGQLTIKDSGCVILEFAAAGGFIGAALWLSGPLITRFLLGDRYSAVDSLWLGFGIFIFARYVASGVGMQLAAIGKPVTRIVGQIPALVILAVSMVTVLPKSTLSLMPWIMTYGAITTAMIYLLFLIYAIRGEKLPINLTISGQND